ncbi:FAD/NAD(P)-binding domain-containing protein [Mollisia scopiformis]|uniref:FAD/NAD(P)-binding domain-containing protein n=1 Tax=Mollisia scopiformis TaxID=149040 RepID=A0A132B3W8_MOLSC|nr:FAD/NAD(P)-binding domain-containing protein [Mollisia scopiformis]KUJ06943.1 FAD/NAD(P)-binding domain-containing protein [Mollisia scopiformis]
MRVIIVGAGVSGLNMLYTLQKYASQVSYVIYDKNPECGGTWYENRYPGCASDDPSHHYQYSHTPNPSWSSVFAPAGEIKEYLNRFIDKNDLRNNIKTGYSVSSAEWHEGCGEWVVKVRDERTGSDLEDRGQVLVDATGIFNNWVWPTIKGLHAFKGPLIHTANWPKDFDHHGKTVAVLGNGATGVQLVPAMQPDVKKLIHCIRSRTWIAGPSEPVQFCQQFTTDSSDRFPEEWKQNLLDNPEEYAKLLSDIDHLCKKERFKTILNGSNEALHSLVTITEYMKQELEEKPELIDILIPTGPVGCRRITSSVGYLKSLCALNVEVAKTQIQAVSTTGILLESGEHIEVDAIICATGFNTSFVPRYPVLGDNGRNLQDEWREENGGPIAYMSVMAEGMPNYFRLLGPNGPLAHGAIPRISTHICDYVLAHIRKMQFEHLASVRPLPSAVEDFNEHVQTFMPRTAWDGKGCGGWYKSKNVNGSEQKVIALHPGSQTHWEKMLANVRWEDFEFRAKSGRQTNRFGYLGNGFAVSEVDNGQQSDSELDKVRFCI